MPPCPSRYNTPVDIYQEISRLQAENVFLRLEKPIRRPVHTCLLPLLLLFLACGAGQGHGLGLQTKTAMLITADPHYRLLLENAQVRVFSLTLPPGTESFVRHEHNYLTVTLADCAPIMWRNEESAIQHFQVPKGEIHFFFGGSAHGIRNDSTAEYRNVTVEFLDPDVTNYGWRYESGKYDFGPSALNPPVDPEGHFVNSLNLEKAVAIDIQLLPKESLPAAAGPQLLIAITPLSFSIASDFSISLAPGEVLWRKAGEPVLPSAGASRQRLAVIEFKTTGNTH
ncbi:MAG TPA: hypothetical protein VGH51_09135 [Candidatus Angelobacter sp.]